MSTPSPERWRLLQRLLDEVLDLPAEQRSSHVAALTDIDDALRDELARLVRASVQGGDFLSRPAAEFAAPLVRTLQAPPHVEARDQRIGPYRVVREIGRGGMGIVYLAERADDQFRQRVAVKLLPYETRSEESVRRFLEERQILATMEHQAIARLLDGGMTADALPYFVMEYVEGMPIDQYCDDRRLTIEARLRLFCSVCEAVQFAHGKLVVHRDIKPSNILVTAVGEVRLLDFGIAKLLTSDAALTSTGARLMTPEYASPEQVRGEPVTTSTDVYSLGVLLYRLLVGRRPYRITGRSHHEIERAIVEEAPVAPSSAVGVDEASARRTTADRLQKTLAGDLDVIVLRALQKEPARRYASVEQLANDVRRHLDGRPVTARPDTWRYRTRKFVKRNRAVVASASVAVLALVGGSGFAIVEARRAVDHARIARREEEKAVQTSKFLVEIFRSVDPEVSRGAPITARELLDRGAERIQRELTSPSQVRASILDEIGLAYHGLLLDSAAERMYQRALDDQHVVYGAEHGEIATTLSQLGIALERTGRLDSSEKVLRSAVAMSRKLFGEHDVRTATALGSLGLTLQVKARYAEAKPLHQQALAIFREIHDSAGMSTTLTNLAWMHQVDGRLDSAVAALQTVVELRRRIYPPDDPRTESAVGSLGDMLRRAERPAEAEPLLIEALTSERKLHGPRSETVAFRLVSLADVRLRQDRRSEADSLFREGIGILREVVGEHDARTAQAMNNYAKSLVDRGQFRQGLKWYEAALDAYRAQFGPAHPFTGIVLGNIANSHHLLGNPARADTLYRQALGILRKAWGEDNPSTVNATVSHGLVLHTLHRDREAEVELRAALERSQHAYKPGHWRIALAENALGAALSSLRRFDEADSLLLHGYRELSAKLGKSALDTRLARERVVEHYRRWQRPELAIRYRSEGT